MKHSLERETFFSSHNTRTRGHPMTLIGGHYKMGKIWSSTVLVHVPEFGGESLVPVPMSPLGKASSLGSCCTGDCRRAPLLLLRIQTLGAGRP